MKFYFIDPLTTSCKCTPFLTTHDIRSFSSNHLFIPHYSTYQSLAETFTLSEGIEMARMHQIETAIHIEPFHFGSLVLNLKDLEAFQKF
jgi:hypothetical protein